MKIGVIALFSLFALSPAATLLPLGTCDVLAQQQGNVTIKGRVVDTYGAAIVGAAVLQKGTTNGTQPMPPSPSLS